MLRVGLTGGIGSGKSTVAALFAARDVPVIDTDQIAREQVQPGSQAYSDIVAAFGAVVLTANGDLDRDAMRTRVFSDAAARERLEAILHPRIRSEVQRRIATITAPYVIVAVPLLIETGFDELIDRILVVDCSEQAQIDRTVARSHMPAPAVRDIMATQASRAQRLSRADDVIHNDGAPADLAPQVARLHARYLDLARA